VKTNQWQTGTWTEIYLYQKSKGRWGKGRNTYTGSKIGFPWFSRKETIQTNWSRDGLRLKCGIIGGVAGTKIEAQCKGRVRGDSMSSLIVTAEERRDSLGVGFENMRRSWVMKWGAQQGLGVVASWWLGDGKAKAQGRGMGWGAIACHHRHVFFKGFTYVFRLSFSIRKVASEHPFCVLIYMNSYIFHIYFILFIFLSNTYLIFNCYMLDVIIGRHTWILWLLPYG